jgi:hypothetical protein
MQMSFMQAAACNLKTSMTKSTNRDSNANPPPHARSAPRQAAAMPAAPSQAATNQAAPSHPPVTSAQNDKSILFFANQNQYNALDLDDSSKDSSGSNKKTNNPFQHVVGDLSPQKEYTNNPAPDIIDSSIPTNNPSLSTDDTAAAPTSFHDATTEVVSNRQVATMLTQKLSALASPYFTGHTPEIAMLKVYIVSPCQNPDGHGLGSYERPVTVVFDTSTGTMKSTYVEVLRNMLLKIIADIDSKVLNDVEKSTLTHCLYDRIDGAFVAEFQPMIDDSYNYNDGRHLDTKEDMADYINDEVNFNASCTVTIAFDLSTDLILECFDPDGHFGTLVRMIIQSQAIPTTVSARCKSTVASCKWTQYEQRTRYECSRRDTRRFSTSSKCLYDAINYLVEHSVTVTCHVPRPTSRSRHAQCAHVETVPNPFRQERQACAIWRFFSPQSVR